MTMNRPDEADLPSPVLARASRDGRTRVVCADGRMYTRVVMRDALDPAGSGRLSHWMRHVGRVGRVGHGRKDVQAAAARWLAAMTARGWESC